MDHFNVFYVNKGQLYAIEPQSPNILIKNLQQQIRKCTGIRIDDQVLIATGGEAVELDKRIGDITGTIQNPVFLFQRPSKHNSLECNVEDEMHEFNLNIEDALEQINLLNHPPLARDIKATYIALPEKARIAKDAGTRAIHACARKIQEHHLLIKGWTALVSNVDENIARVRKKTNRHRANIERVRQQNEKAIQILQDFDNCIQQLKQIIVPGIILSHSRGIKDASTATDLSLYDWISMFDPNNTLESIADSVREQFNQYGTSGVEEICHHFDGLVAYAKKETREIKGINMRFSQLEQNLGMADAFNKDILSRVQKIVQSTPISDPYAMQERVNEQLNEMDDIQKLLKELRKTFGLFHKSKVELLNNLKTRLTGWTVTCYEMLHTCATEVVVFEEKFNGIKSRLEIVHQVKETPILFLTAVCEVIRRAALQKEFNAWHKQHVDRCTAFAKTEDETRSQISNKLQNHFLRVLFPGIFDKFPEFFVKVIPKYDEELPPVSADYIRQLRQAVKELESFLKVTTPQVFAKLCVRDVTGSLSSPGSGSTMRREESFFTADSTQNIATMNKNFPSTTWLGGLENFDNSPSIQPAIPIGTSPPIRTGSTTSMSIPVAPSLNQLSQLAEQEEAPGSVLGKSAPIDIPIAVKTREVSEKSSQFSTPEDHFNPPETESSGELRDDGSKDDFALDDLNSRSQQSMEVLKMVLEEVAKISKGLLDVRADVINSGDEFGEDFKALTNYTTQMTECRLKEEEKRFAAELKDRDDLISKLKAQLEKKQSALYDAKEKIAVYQQSEIEKNEKIQHTTEKIETLENEAKEFETKLREAEAEIFKKLTIEYALQDEKTRIDYDEIVQQKESELRGMKKDLDKKLAEIETLRADPDSESYRKQVAADIRSDLEKEFKNKIDLITKGLMQQREDAINRNKKEFEFELNAAKNKHQFITKFLVMEKDQLKDIIQEELENGLQMVEDIDKEMRAKFDESQKLEKTFAHFLGRTVSIQTEDEPIICINSPQSPLPISLQFSTYGPSPPVMDQSHYSEMAQSTFQLQQPVIEENKATHEVHRRDDKTVDCAVQTRIHMKAMELMVAVQDIAEGSTVLVVWSERHNAYMLFSSSSYLHFVKESSVRRLGLSMLEGSRRNWIFGRVLHLDLCMIRKPSNRYNLPIDTRVYRVDVEAIPLEVKAIKEPELI